MRARLKNLWNAAPVATGTLIAAALFAAVFVVHLLVSTLIWHKGPQAEQSVAPWMTPRYIAHAFHVPHDMVLGAVEMPEPLPKKRMSLEQIAVMKGAPVEDLIQATTLAIDDYFIAHPDRRDWTRKEWRDFTKSQERQLESGASTHD